MATIQKRGNRWRAQIRRLGYPNETRTFSSKSDAQMWARKIESQMDRDEYGPESDLTLAELVEHHIEEKWPDPKRHRTPRQQLRWWVEQLGEYQAKSIKATTIRGAVEELKTERNLGPASVNRYLATLSGVYSKAIRDEKIKNNPVSRVGKETEPKGRQRYLDENTELGPLLDACKAHSNPHLYTAVALALATGLRRGEIESLTWDRVNLPKHQITLNAKSGTKVRQTRNVPLYGIGYHAMLAHAKVYRRIDSPLVFPGRLSDPTRQTDLGHDFREAVIAAGIKNFRFHDLRHSAASMLANSGAELLDIMTILGHQQMQTTKRYAHLTEKRTHGVAQRMAAKYLS